MSDDITKQKKIEIHLKADKEICSLNDSVTNLSKQIGTQEEAIDYVLSYMENAPRLWADASPDMRALYQSMIFPESIKFTFYTNNIGALKMSALHTLANTKKDPSMSDESLVVSLVVGSWNTLLPTLIRMADDLEELGFRYSDNEQVYRTYALTQRKHRTGVSPELSHKSL